MMIDYGRSKAFGATLFAAMINLVSAGCGSDCKPKGVEDCRTDEDDDSNGLVNEVDALGCSPFFVDGDGDGWGGGEPKCLCEPIKDHTIERGGDCDDEDAQVHPTAMEPCVLTIPGTKSKYQRDISFADPGAPQLPQNFHKTLPTTDASDASDASEVEAEVERALKADVLKRRNALRKAKPQHLPAPRALCPGTESNCRHQCRKVIR